MEAFLQKSYLILYVVKAKVPNDKRIDKSFQLTRSLKSLDPFTLVKFEIIVGSKNKVWKTN